MFCFVRGTRANSFLLLLSCIYLSKAFAAQRLYYPPGVQRNVDQAELVGWTLCYSALASDNHASIENILSACGPVDLVMIGASEVREPNTITLLAARPANDFFTNHTHIREHTECTRFDLEEKHQHNGAWWYNIDGLAFGFAGKKNIYPCYGDDELDDCEHRMSWHQLTDTERYVGYRVGCNAAPHNYFTKLVWKATNPCTIPGLVPSYANGDFVECVCADPLEEFDPASGTCYVPCAKQAVHQASPPTSLRQKDGAALGTCECNIDQLQGQPVSNCACPPDASLDLETMQCVCNTPGTTFDSGLLSCVGCHAIQKAACAPEAECGRDTDGFFCTCPDGFEGDGLGSSGCVADIMTTPLDPECNATQQAACAPEAECAIDGPDAWCHCPPGYEGDGLGPNGCYIPGCSNLLEPARGCNLWVKEDLRLGTGDIQGKVCVGGSMVVGEGLSLGTALPQNMACPQEGLHEYGLVVGGDIKWDHGRKYVGAHCVGGSLLDPVSQYGPLTFPGCKGDIIQQGQGSGCADVIDFAADYERLLASSDELSAGPTGYHPSTAVLSDGVILVLLDTAHASHVVQLDAELFQGFQAWGFRITSTDGGSLDAVEVVVLNLVNVPSNGVVLGKYFDCREDGLNCFDMPPRFGAKILFNYNGQFPLAAAGGSTIPGSILAPRASLAGVSAGTIRGQVVVRSYHTTASASTGFEWQPLEPSQVCLEDVDVVSEVNSPGLVGSLAHELSARRGAALYSEGGPLGAASSQQTESVDDDSEAEAPSWATLGLAMLIGALWMGLVCAVVHRQRAARSEQLPTAEVRVSRSVDGKEHRHVEEPKHADWQDVELGCAPWDRPTRCTV